MTDVFVDVRFDVHTLTKHLSAQDPPALVIRSHLYVESALIRLIEAALVKKKAVDVARFAFPTKVELAVALGKIPETDTGALNALNRLRRRFAHDLGTQVHQQDERDLYNVLSNEQRAIADSLRKPEMQTMARMRCDLLAIIIHLEAVVKNRPIVRIG